MDLDAQLDKLEKLSSPLGKAKSKAMDEAVDKVKIWQSNELDLDENREDIYQLMKDLDLLHRENMAPKPILELSLGPAKDVLNLHTRYKEAKTATNRLEKHIEELQAQLAGLEEKQNKLGAGLGTKTKATFLVQNMVAASRQAL
ncbi:hypothetical protein L3X38_030292 [Prunus dulcis]|uniref:Uncharacterized protein n=1 Tax=Prunus dulcis TaxID=3755 RepID=A0AAD4VB75_PRUDU|nr:hypothetical protein L3X38_030292 [Prunus dulcis]